MRHPHISFESRDRLKICFLKEHFGDCRTPAHTNALEMSHAMPRAKRINNSRLCFCFDCVEEHCHVAIFSVLAVCWLPACSRCCQMMRGSIFIYYIKRKFVTYVCLHVLNSDSLSSHSAAFLHVVLFLWLGCRLLEIPSHYRFVFLFIQIIMRTCVRRLSKPLTNDSPLPFVE